ncbi:Glycosyl transferase group 1 [Sulfurovum sp. enrichment culture clone C5]|uniref:Glycosyl transferase group 1 n=1 Tax=Sulfurovum sp. enrichment culture clone C5 TaxID=497650 RepID=A0A0S4XR72_9BACT|nr:Glycosyl transferase group 1 [Sulfurovum sp. enrichment culture clone C5]
MNIWIINHHALTPDMSGGTRHYDFAKELIKRGYQVTIISSSIHYSTYKELKDYKENNYLKENIDGIEWIWIKTPIYVGNGARRVRNMLSFMHSVSSTVPKLNLIKPDIIIGSSVHLFAVYAAYKLSKKYKVPLVMEVRDLWPQTLIDMGISKWHPFILLLAWLEKFLYKKANKIITLLPKAHLYIEKLGIEKEKIVWISNGANINHLKHTKKLDSNKFNVVYTGSVGVANDLSVLVGVANILKDKDEIHFTIIGNGVMKQGLINEAKNLNLKNITFLDPVPKSEVYNYLYSASLLYVGLKNLPLYRYGMSMNKIFDYMSVAKPVLFVSDIDENIVNDARCGFVIKNPSPNKIADLIEKISQMPSNELKILGKNGYDYMTKFFSTKVLCDKLENILKEVIDNEKSV